MLRAPAILEVSGEIEILTARAVQPFIALTIQIAAPQPSEECRDRVSVYAGRRPKELIDRDVENLCERAKSRGIFIDEMLHRNAASAGAQYVLECVLVGSRLQSDVGTSKTPITRNDVRLQELERKANVWRRVDIRDCRRNEVALGHEQPPKRSGPRVDDSGADYRAEAAQRYRYTTTTLPSDQNRPGSAACWRRARREFESWKCPLPGSCSGIAGLSSA